MPQVLRTQQFHFRASELNLFQFLWPYSSLPFQIFPVFPSVVSLPHLAEIVVYVENTGLCNQPPKCHSSINHSTQLSTHARIWSYLWSLFFHWVLYFHWRPHLYLPVYIQAKPCAEKYVTFLPQCQWVKDILMCQACGPGEPLLTTTCLQNVRRYTKQIPDLLCLSHQSVLWRFSHFFTNVGMGTMHLPLPHQWP